MTQAAPHPRMHGLTHIPGGPDPIPGLLPPTATDYPGLILADPCLRHYWPADETSGDLVDRKGTVDLERQTFLFEDDDQLYPQYGAPGPFGDNAILMRGIGGSPPGNTGSFRSSVAIPSIPGSFTVELWLYLVEFTRDPPAVDPGGSSIFILGSTFTGASIVIANGLQLNGLYDSSPFVGPWTAELADPDVFPLGAWQHLALRYDLDDATSTGTLDLFRNGTVRDSQTGVPLGSGALTAATPTWMNKPTGSSPTNGYSAHLAIYDCALSNATIVNHSNMLSGPGSGYAGDVLTVGDDGSPAWEPPGVEVTHGDGAPDEAPVTRPPSLSGPVNGSGWHLNAHVETAVLYDSSPARFDVPSRTWTRVPFNTVRIQRQWETELDGDIVSAWLPDDRGLTAQAANGLLHVSADMGSPQDVSGWFTIEYPVLDFTGLPDSTPGGAADAYARAARVVDASTDAVLRETPGSADRQFFEWLFRDFAADGLVGIVQYTADSPYPVYASWPARPLLKPGPYPQIDPASSLVYYKRDAFYGGFSHEYGLGVVDATLAAGANLCLQAWQDTPWQLRFSTDHFPNYTPLPYPELWKQRPYLALSYSYDPDSVDHDTGRLL